MPPGLERGGQVPCEVLDVNGTKVALLCLEREGAEPAHLYVVDRAQLKDAASINTAPQFSRQGPCTVAMWVDNKHLYVLAGAGDAASLKGLLSVLSEMRAPGSRLVAHITSTWNPGLVEPLTCAYLH
jgi:hypothetical protein